jgi:EmrB/QacA subfamily drug resistance transporter
VSPSGERIILAVVALGTMLAPLNSTMIVVGLPHIMAEFAAGPASAAWLVVGYLVTMAALQPVAGKLGDRFGRRGLVIGGLACFGLASLAATVANSLPLLVFCRVLQAAAGAVALPNAAALVREVLPAHRRASGFGLVGAAAAVAAAAGPTLGGFLVDIAGWRAIFYVNVPLVVASIALGWRSIPRTEHSGPRQAFDLPGAIMLPVLLGGMAALLTRGLEVTPAVLIGGLAVLATGVALFLVCELRHVDPVLQPRLFRDQTFAAANGAVALGNLAMYVTLLSVPILLSTRAGWTSAQTGLVLTALFAAMVVCAPLGGRLADRLGRRWPVVAGHVLLAVAVLPLPLAGSSITTGLLLGSLGLAGVGLGIAQAGLQTAALESVDRQHAGVASGVFSTSRYLGGIVGASAMAGLLGPSREPAGLTAVFVMVLAAALLSVVAGLGIAGSPKAPPG